MREEHFKALETQWHKFYDQYEAVNAMQPTIVRWEWSRPQRYDPRPYHFLRGYPRGHLLKQIPETAEKKLFHYEYGFDDRDRVVFERYHGGARSVETFYIYEPHLITSLSYQDYQGRSLLVFISNSMLLSGQVEYYASLRLNYEYVDPTHTAHLFLQDKPYRGEGLDTAISTDTWNRLSNQIYGLFWWHETYVYTNKRLNTVQYYTQHSLTNFSESKQRFEYDQQGNLQKILSVSRDDERGRLVYRRRKRGETLASFTEKAKQKLIDVIPQILSGANLKERLYSLNLYYTYGGFFPPALLLGFEKDRQRKLEESDKETYQVAGDIWWYLWDTDEDEPEHVPHDPVEIEDADTLEACEILDVEIKMRHHFKLGVKILYEVCQELNRLDWSQYAPVTPDFIVYACDQTEHVRIPDTLRLSGATEQQIMEWYQRGMLDLNE